MKGDLIVDDKEVQALFDRLIRKGKDTLALMRRLSSDLKDAVEENFEKQGRPKGKPLHPATIKYRAKKGYTGSILQRTRGLKNSITTKSTSNEAVVGTNKKYAGVHQFGYEKRNIPARPFLKTTKEDVEGFKRTILNYIMEWFSPL